VHLFHGVQQNPRTVWIWVKRWVGRGLIPQFLFFLRELGSQTATSSHNRSYRIHGDSTTPRTRNSPVSVDKVLCSNSSEAVLHPGGLVSPDGIIWNHSSTVISHFRLVLWPSGPDGFRKKEWRDRGALFEIEVCIRSISPVDGNRWTNHRGLRETAKIFS